MSFLNQLLGSERRSARTAKERLQLVLVHDRADLSPGKLEALKNDLGDRITDLPGLPNDQGGPGPFR